MGRQISIPENTEVLALQIVQTVENAQLAAKQYSSLRVRMLPNDGRGEEARQEWRETYPPRDEESFTIPAVQRLLETL